MCLILVSIVGQMKLMAFVRSFARSLVRSFGRAIVRPHSHSLIHSHIRSVLLYIHSTTYLNEVEQCRLDELNRGRQSV